MKTVIGIDVGGTTTKIVGFNQGELIEPLFVKSGDPITSIYGAFGKFTHKNGIALSDISRVMITGAGNAYVTNPIYGLDCRHVGEFGSVAKGGMYLSGLDEAIVVSMGTGTALVHAKADGSFEYLGGTGVGGGTLLLVYMTTLAGLDQHLAQGINLLYFLPAGLTALPAHLKNGYVEKGLLFPAISAGLLCAALASWAATALDVDLLRKLFGGFLILIGVSELFGRVKEET